ncbi:DUF58 domain-containing protein [uncultured Bifidobacterium sp.]|uniref:DUF58 domain-containing protein n=1 Tax=uncultured Bifidobacterium sp. TaxID=165187 RepID=UPI0028DB05A9|nr:DUF58 domain-containing protein [uncultured Bifidobacterium sp.]
MTEGSLPAEHVRRRIERLGSTLGIPTVRRALGLLEGEHPSGRAGGSGDVMDIRPYTVEDEARLIDWRASARAGRPLVVRRERTATSRVWMLVDVGREMTGICPSGERAWAVAANALCMVASLSLRRFDDISLVFADSRRIVRMPFHGGLSRFERMLDTALDRDWDAPRDMDSLLDYASSIADRRCMVVLATEDHALRGRHVPMLRRLTRGHPLLVASVVTANPLAAPQGALGELRLATRGRRIPAFLMGDAAARDVDVHRRFLSESVGRELTRHGARIMRADSSDSMFGLFVRQAALARGTAQGAQGLADAAAWRAR